MSKEETSDLSNIPGTRAAMIQEKLQQILDIPEALLKSVCTLVESLTNDAYTEGYEDGQWNG
jgi:hypothetical protein